MRIPSFVIADAVLKQATERFAPEFVPDQSKIDILKNYCEVIDSIMEEEVGAAFTCDVNEFSMRVSLSMDLVSLTVNDPANDAFQRLIVRAYPTEFSASEGGEYLRVTFTFPPVWVHA